MKLLGFVFLAKGRRAFATGVTRSRGAGLGVLRRGERYVKSREGHQSNCDSVDSYRDEPAAIEWLCRAFGFEKQLVVADQDGTISHAQLSFGNGMIIIGSLPDSEFSTYVVVSDPDVLYARAKAAGAEIVREIKDEDYGGRGFTCRDLEGHLWSFGTYDPW